MNNLTDFIKYLDYTIKDKSLYEYLNVFDKYIGTDWKKYIKILDKKLNKNYHKETIFKNDIFDLHIISWNTVTPIHDHAENGCIFKLLEGNLIEQKYDKNINLISENFLVRNDCSYIDNDIGYHKIINNNGGKQSFSIHLYSPPLYKINSFT